ncbi:bifunctional pyr operon transcriptional regulator/uracil phosphoribosyltransferase PyrR [sulfur-oxidizing endosymbiont of Gigantopelta aegis]|uniref:bifunctional pyr operon transcriptional regulator/uracil phosphoribosyltransferase PyrR n=1 Tax=sulfur-oxidizing endosymbiont of Gigantopelta aegis TaxID=2794934 RepID=UPI0018DCA019|nr:bifunctional pyr operon transcriptional regulator/uracil phosphoribosyltransferase PyrR [sulfur-oxidizing endosymbiont of Gigantopelta aegis]
MTTTSSVESGSQEFTPAIDLQQLLDTMYQAIARKIQGLNKDDVIVIGIHTGGFWVAEKLYQRLNIPSPLGSLNISFYRDDFTKIGLHPEVKPSHLPTALDDKHIILIDDVLYTGRTVRAALNEIFDYGRPASVTLAVLLDRGGRELPVHAEIIGQKITLDAGQQIKLCGPEPLKLVKNRC